MTSCYQLDSSISSMENDVELLNSASKWNKEALVKIFDLYAPALYRYASRLGHDPISADHIVGDVFVKLLENISQGKEPRTNLRSYLYQLTYPLIVDNARYSHRTPPLDEAHFLEVAPHPISAGFENQVMLDVIIKAIRDDLTDDQRHVIVLRFMEDFSLKETAAILGKGVGNIKVIQNRAIAKLRKHLERRNEVTVDAIKRQR